MEKRAKFIGAGIALLLLCFIVLWVRGISSSHNKERIAAAQALAAQAAMEKPETSKKAFAEVEEERENLLEAQRQEQMISRQKERKAKSEECQFWRLQKKSGKSAVADGKILQYCYIAGDNPEKEAAAKEAAKDAIAKDAAAKDVTVKDETLKDTSEKMVSASSTNKI